MLMYTREIFVKNPTLQTPRPNQIQIFFVYKEIIAAAWLLNGVAILQKNPK